MFGLSLVTTQYLRSLEGRVALETAAAFAARDIARSEREMRISEDALVTAVVCSALGESFDTVLRASRDPLSPATRARVEQFKADYRAQRASEREADEAMARAVADATADTNEET